MIYLKLNGIDYSSFVSGLSVKYIPIYEQQKNAAGDMVVDLINKKHLVEVEFIPSNLTDSSRIINEIVNTVPLTIEYLEPTTQALNSFQSIVPSCNISYYTIRTEKQELKKYSVKFEEM